MVFKKKFLKYDSCIILRTFAILKCVFLIDTFHIFSYQLYMLKKKQIYTKGVFSRDTFYDFIKLNLY